MNIDVIKVTIVNILNINVYIADKPNSDSVNEIGSKTAWVTTAQATTTCMWYDYYHYLLVPLLLLVVVVEVVVVVEEREREWPVLSTSHVVRWDGAPRTRPAGRPYIIEYTIIEYDRI